MSITIRLALCAVCITTVLSSLSCSKEVTRNNGSGEIDLPLAADWPNRPRQRVDRVHGKPSLTRWQVVSRDAPDQVRVSFEPVTGRSHQLRVHAAAMGWPISGDPLYGPAEATAPRLMLNACSLSLNHPDSGQPLQWLSPSPF